MASQVTSTIAERAKMRHADGGDKSLKHMVCAVTAMLDEAVRRSSGVAGAVPDAPDASGAHFLCACANQDAETKAARKPHAKGKPRGVRGEARVQAREARAYDLCAQPFCVTVFVHARRAIACRPRRASRRLPRCAVRWRFVWSGARIVSERRPWQVVNNWGHRLKNVWTAETNAEMPDVASKLRACKPVLKAAAESQREVKAAIAKVRAGKQTYVPLSIAALVMPAGVELANFFGATVRCVKRKKLFKKWVYPTTVLEVTRDNGDKVRVLSAFGNKTYEAAV